MKKVLFIDRDGTLIWEPPDTFQVDSLSKLKFLPGAIPFLKKIVEELDFELVMVSNQDGLGSAGYPVEKFNVVQNQILKSLQEEGITFSEVLVDGSFQHENKPTRKPGIAMLYKYLGREYDLKNSFVIGDRITDIQLAKNLGAKAIVIRNYENVEDWKDRVSLIANTWEEIYEFLHSLPYLS